MLALRQQFRINIVVVSTFSPYSKPHHFELIYFVDLRWGDIAFVEVDRSLDEPGSVFHLDAVDYAVVIRT